MNQKTDATPMLQIVPLGNVDPMVLAVITAHLQALLGMNADIDSVEENPQYAFISGRRQYDAAKIIAQLSQRDSTRFQLGVMARDLCTPILTYVYGESQLGGNAAVISLYRLKHRQRQVAFERAAKIGLHEVGHLLGIGHCWQAHCLMRFCSTLERLDDLPLTFCSACEYEINRRLTALMRSDL